MLARALLSTKFSVRAPNPRIMAMPTRGYTAKPKISFVKPHSFAPQCRVSSSCNRQKSIFAVPRRMYADSPFLKEADVESRVLHVVKSFQKVDPAGVKKDSKFTDLGLDSLDIVELGLEIESEFAVEIPDAEMEKINSIPDAVKYICSHPTAK